jgi:ABC-2 type transport system ATP-binding protein
MKMDFSDSSFIQKYVLKNISFKIERGEFAAIMGRNGMGKSTILKIITGIYSPSAGQVSVNGRLAPLLELGAGFDPQLTGYENIFLYGSILGYDNATISSQVFNIVEFSEIGESIYLPLKNYSSGMLVRLGFSIVINLDFDVLLLDEVLGVGDARFYKKSVEKIIELHKKGKTILLVTHSFEQVMSYCQRCILINEGEILADGSPSSVKETYNELMDL